MIGYISCDAIGSTDAEWSTGAFVAAVESLIADLTDEQRLEYRFSQGDALQLELEGARTLRVACLVYLKMRLQLPKGLRLACAVGSRSAALAKQPLELRTGAVYTAAGRGVSTLRERKRKLGFFAVEQLDTPWEVVVMLASALMEQLTTRQAEVMYLAILNTDLTQADLAAELGISTRSTVSQQLKAAHAEEILEMIARFEAYYSR